MRKMQKIRIQLRPYHPTYLIGYYGMGGHPESYNSKGFNDLIEKIRSNPDIEVQFVKGFDDICKKCSRLIADERGSIWGQRHRCPSSENDRLVQEIHQVNRKVLDLLGLDYGSVISLKDLVNLLKQRIPFLFSDLIGGADFQKQYEKGLVEISNLWK